MKKILTILTIITLHITSLAQQADYPIMCFKGANSAYFYIIENNKTYYYNFSNHMLDVPEFKVVYWKQSSKLPIDTSLFEMICNTRIDSSQISSKLKKQLK